MRGGVAVAAHQGAAGQGEPLFGADDMDDALFGGDRIDIADAEAGRVRLERGQLLRALAIGDRQAPAVGADARRGRQIMIGHRQRQIGAADGATGDAQSLERLRARHLMDEMAIDIDQAGAVIARRDDMRIPDLFVEGAGAGRHGAALRAARAEQKARGIVVPRERSAGRQPWPPSR